MRLARAKIFSPARLRASLPKGARIVFTNGCFDLVHEGHVTYLEKARRLGDCLVVALDSDASVRALKGPGRPLNRLGARARVVAALECVDRVTWFGGSDPRPLIRRLRPQVLVKGGDWPVEKILGSAEVLSWGGRVRSISLVPGISTTRLVQRASLK